MYLATQRAMRGLYQITVINGDYAWRGDSNAETLKLCGKIHTTMSRSTAVTMQRMDDAVR